MLAEIVQSTITTTPGITTRKIACTRGTRITLSLFLEAIEEQRGSRKFSRFGRHNMEFLLFLT